jgi:hypothetical protein
MRSLMLALVCIVTFIPGPLSQAQSRTARSAGCFVGAPDLLDTSAPRFDQFRVTVAAAKTPHKLEPESNPVAARFQTVIGAQMRREPNFAGHYQVAVWGCGSSCAQYAVVDLETGRVILADGVATVSSVNFAADDFLPGSDSDFWGFRFKKDSRLLVFVGTINEDHSKEGAFYYLIDHGKLLEVHKTVVKRGTCE